MLTGFKKITFENLGKACVIVVICDDTKMLSLLDDTEGKLRQPLQRALRKNTIMAIEENFEQYSAMSVFHILENHVCKNCIKPVRESFTLANA